MHSFVFEILGLIDETKNITGSDVIEGLMGLILDIRKSAREKKIGTLQIRYAIN